MTAQEAWARLSIGMPAIQHRISVIRATLPLHSGPEATRLSTELDALLGASRLARLGCLEPVGGHPGHLRLEPMTIPDERLAIIQQQEKA